MARIRTIKPEFTKDEDLSSLPAEAHLFAAGLLCEADDYGYFNANPKLLQAAIFPLRETSVSVPEILQKLSEIGFIELLNGSDGKRYGRVVKFLQHQRVSHPTPSKIAPLVSTPEKFGNPPEPLRPERKGKEGKGKEEEPLFAPASPETFDGQDWCLRTCKAHPKWEAPDALDVPQAISQVYMTAVDGHAKNFAGDFQKAAEDILARTRQFARDVADDKIVVGVLNFFRNGVYLEHQPERQTQPKPPMTVEEEAALLRAAKEYCPRAN